MEISGSFRKLGVPCMGVLIIRIHYYVGYYIRVPYCRKLPYAVETTWCSLCSLLRRLHQEPHNQINCSFVSCRLMLKGSASGTACSFFNPSFDAVHDCSDVCNTGDLFPQLGQCNDFMGCRGSYFLNLKP